MHGLSHQVVDPRRLRRLTPCNDRAPLGAWPGDLSRRIWPLRDRQSMNSPEPLNASAPRRTHRCPAFRSVRSAFRSFDFPLRSALVRCRPNPQFRSSAVQFARVGVCERDRALPGRPWRGSCATRSACDGRPGDVLRTVLGAGPRGGGLKTFPPDFSYRCLRRTFMCASFQLFFSAPEARVGGVSSAQPRQALASDCASAGLVSSLAAAHLRIVDNLQRIIYKTRNVPGLELLKNEARTANPHGCLLSGRWGCAQLDNPTAHNECYVNLM